MQLTGADILIRTLIEQGCDTVFGYPGGQILNVYDSLYKYQNEIRHMLTAHEQGAAHAADGYARATGKVGVVMSTSGPGATNLVTGIATAYLDSIPLVAICGNVPTTQIGTDSFQEIDITGVTLPITKHNYFVGSVENLADTIREAFALAQSGQTGARCSSMCRRTCRQRSATTSRRHPYSPKNATRRRTCASKKPRRSSMSRSARSFTSAAVSSHRKRRNKCWRSPRRLTRRSAAP